jgi:hypothetical protein
MKLLNIGIIAPVIFAVLTPQSKAMEIRNPNTINSNDRKIRVEELFIEASTDNKDTVDRAETNVPKRNLQNNRKYKPIDCFRNINKSRRN